MIVCLAVYWHWQKQSFLRIDCQIWIIIYKTVPIHLRVECKVCLYLGEILIKIPHQILMNELKLSFCDLFKQTLVLRCFYRKCKCIYYENLMQTVRKVILQIIKF